METTGGVLQDQPSYCSQLDYEGFGHDVMPVVEYGPTKEYFEQLDEIQEDRDLDSDGVETRFVNHWGWDYPQWQSLYQAEQEYSGTDDEHELSTWEDRGIKSPEVEDAYDNDDSAENEKAWNIENTGATNENVYSEENPETEEEIFDGGFAGKCSEEEAWQWEGDSFNEWRCSGNVPWHQGVMLPEVSGDVIGIVVMPYNAYGEDEDNPEHVPDFWNSYPQATAHAEHRDTEQLIEMEATCWPGGVGDEPEDYDEAEHGVDYIQETVSVSSEEPFGIYGEVDLSDHNRYSCSWEYDDGLEESGGPPIILHDADSILDEIVSDDLEDAREVQQGFLDAHSGLHVSYRDADIDFATAMEQWNTVKAE